MLFSVLLTRLLGRGFAKIIMVAPPVGIEPTTDWLTASAPDKPYQSQLLYLTELQRQHNDYSDETGNI